LGGGPCRSRRREFGGSCISTPQAVTARQRCLRRNQELRRVVIGSPLSPARQRLRVVISIPHTFRASRYLKRGAGMPEPTSRDDSYASDPACRSFERRPWQRSTRRRASDIAAKARSFPVLAVSTLGRLRSGGKSNTRAGHTVRDLLRPWLEPVKGTSGSRHSRKGSRHLRKDRDTLRRSRHSRKGSRHST
jgi:hypothetical protein